MHTSAHGHFRVEIHVLVCRSWQARMGVLQSRWTVVLMVWMTLISGSWSGVLGISRQEKELYK